MTIDSKHDLGLRLIIGYKLGKGAAELVLGAGIGVLWWLGLTTRLPVVADSLVHHLVHRWSIALAHALLSHVTPRLFHLVVLALTVDGLVALFEGWALRRRYGWSAWLVVVATGGLVPFEVVELVRDPRGGRLLLLVVNLAVVVYLTLRIIRKRGRQAAAATPARGAASQSPIVRRPAT
jgi:uncharacterized membrane protein (DUF2068 family)